MVSVIIPVYNIEKYLPACIESVCGQTLSNLEIILVDDGSTDHSGAICDEYAKKDSRIVVIHKENGGLVSARQAGLKVATGSYVGYVDGDDWIEPEMYEDMLAACEQEYADVAISAYYYKLRGSNHISRPQIPAGVYRLEDQSKQKLLHNLIYTENFKTIGIMPNLWSKLFKKELLCKYQFHVDSRITYGEDAACAYPCLIDADRVVVMDQAYYHYRIREGSICNSADPRYFERITLLYQQLKGPFSKHDLAELLMEQLDRYMLDLVLQGVNKMFGFPFGKVIPTAILPYDLPQRNHLETIILYGAGEIGQRYYRWYEETKAVRIAAWVDQNWEKYRTQGFPVQPISALNELEYDGILVAVSSSDLANEIKQNLRMHGISETKIFYEEPRNLIQTLQKHSS